MFPVHVLLKPSLRDFEHNVTSTWNECSCVVVWTFFPILLFSSISLHWSLRKAFLSLFAILWSSAFKWVYLSFFSSSFLIYFMASDSHFAFLHFFFLGIVLTTISCTVMNLFSSSSGTLSIRCNPLNLFANSTVQSQGIWFRSYVNGLVVFPTFFNLSLNFAVRSLCSEPQSAPGLVFADSIELLHLWLQRI